MKLVFGKFCKYFRTIRKFYLTFDLLLNVLIHVKTSFLTKKKQNHEKKTKHNQNVGTHIHTDRESMTHFLFIDNNNKQHGSERKIIIHILRKRL